MNGFTCPLSTEKQQFDNVEALVLDCRNAQCSFVDSDLDTDYLPSSCVLLVACLLASDNHLKLQGVAENKKV
jgi:hypothetical protein